MIKMSWLRAVLEPWGGQTVTSGNLTSDIGWISTEVDTGDSSQELIESIIRNPADEKPQKTMKIHKILDGFTFSVEIY